MNYKIIFANIVFVLALFPYITPFNFSFDTQPWALMVACIFAAIIFFKEKIILPDFLKILLIFTVYAGMILALSLISGKSDLFMGMRSIVGYISIFIFSFIGYKTFDFVRTKYFIWAVTIFLLVAFCQLIFGTEIVTPFLSRFSTGGSRGLTSLASEPAFYASLCISFLILNEIFYVTKKYGTKSYIIVFLMSILQIVLSYSAVGVMLLVLFGFGKLFELLFIKEEKQKKLLAMGVIILIIISIALFFSNKLLGQKRAGEVLQQSVKDPVVLISTNKSVSNRLMNPVVGIYGGIIETKGMGVGIGTKEGGFPPLWLAKYTGSDFKFQGRIEGGLVLIIYELGLIGILYLLNILWLVIRSILHNYKLRNIYIISILSLFAPMFVFGSIAFPLLGYIIGIHLFYLNNKISQ